MFRAGLYVGSGAFGIEMAQSVSRGSFDGRGGPVPLSGIPLGPRGFEEVPFQPSFSPPGAEEIESLEPGRPDSVVPDMRSFANRSARAPAEVDVEEPFIAGATDDMARECMLSGFGDTEGLTLCVGGAKTLSEPVLV